MNTVAASRILLLRYDARIRYLGMTVQKFSLLAAIRFCPGEPVSVLAWKILLETQTLPPALNLETPMPEAEGFDLLSGTARGARVEHVLTNAFGFGGVNAALVFSRAR